MKKLIYLEDVLTVDEYKKFLNMLKKDWPQVYNAWMANQQTVKENNKEAMK